MGNGKSIAGFVLGIVGIVFGILNGWFSVIGLPIVIVGLILSIQGGKAIKADTGKAGGIATAGLVLGIIAVVFTGIAVFTCGLCVICAAGVTGGLDSFINKFFDSFPKYTEKCLIALKSVVTMR